MGLFHHFLNIFRSDLQIKYGLEKALMTIALITTSTLAISSFLMPTNLVSAAEPTVPVVRTQTESSGSTRLSMSHEDVAEISSLRNSSEVARNFQVPIARVSTPTHTAVSPRDLYIPENSINTTIAYANSANYLTCQNTYDVCDFTSSGHGVYLYGHNYRSLGNIARMYVGQQFTYKGATYRVISNIVLDNANASSSQANTYLNNYRRTSGTNELMMQTCANASGTLIRFVKAVRV